MERNLARAFSRRTPTKSATRQQSARQPRVQVRRRKLRREQDNNNLVGGARPDYVFQGLWDMANGAPIFEQVDVNPTYRRPAQRRPLACARPITGCSRRTTGRCGRTSPSTWELRWEYFSPPTEAHGDLSNLFFGSQGLANSTGEGQ